MNIKKKKYAIVLLGPTGVGKTDLSISVAEHFGADIVSSDSRQLYKQMRIGTAVPSEEQLRAVKHHFIQTVDLTDHYTAGRYEREAMAKIAELHTQNDFVVVSGGSGMYIDALCDGIDDIAPSDQTIREALLRRIETEGIESLVAQLGQLDNAYLQSIEAPSKNRIVRALEVCLVTGEKYSDLRTGIKKERPFEILKIGLNRPRDLLYERINKRVDAMVDEGLIEEARSLYEFRHLNALQTVGYRELYEWMDGKCTQEEAIDTIKRNSRRYAKRQMTWFNRDNRIKWFSPEQYDEIISYIEKW